MSKTIVILSLLSCFLFGGCGIFSDTGAQSEDFEVKLDGLPAECAQSLKTAMTGSLTIDNGTDSIGPFSAGQDGTSMHKVFKKNSVNGASLFLETSHCQPLRFCVILKNMSPACAAAVSAAVGHPVKNGDELCTGYITPSPCGTWKFGPGDLH